MTRALVIGAGSIGTRHAAILTELGHDVAVVSRRAEPGGPVYARIDAALRDHRPDYVVLATETGHHLAGVSELLDLGFAGDLLVEKPLAVPSEVLRSAPLHSFGVAFNLRFHPVIVALRDVLAGRPVLTVEAYAGQHLSGWRPGRSTANQYSATREHGGGVLRDLSHELDYLTALFGACQGVFARGGRLGDVTVDSDDAWGIVTEFERAPVVTVQLNYLDRRTRRRLVINTGEQTIEADLVANTLTIDGDVETFSGDRSDSYRAMHRAMLDDRAAVTTLEEAVATDELIAMIETSAATRAWVAPEGI
ncbi:MAG: Gfo/Idh/MocA family oxidoreductase [Pseudolysinimonas sp.]